MARMALVEDCEQLVGVFHLTASQKEFELDQLGRDVGPAAGRGRYFGNFGPEVGVFERGCTKPTVVELDRVQATARRAPPRGLGAPRR
jgi:hypothetical protein